ncbi:hypothetical protein OKW41_008683 [Paraburkholderia sp. UCT70]
MSEIGSAVLVFALLLIATGLGVGVRPLLPEEHKAHETVQLVQLVIGMLVTFAALVLGLMTASAKASFDTASNDMRSYAAELIEFDSTLRELGSAADESRRLAPVHGGGDRFDMAARARAERRLSARSRAAGQSAATRKRASGRYADHGGAAIATAAHAGCIAATCAR